MAVKPQRAKAQAQQRCAHAGDRVRDFPWSYNPLRNGYQVDSTGSKTAFEYPTSIPSPGWRSGTGEGVSYIAARATHDFRSSHWLPREARVRSPNLTNIVPHQHFFDR